MMSIHDLPAVLRGISADLDAMGKHVSDLSSDLELPAAGSPLAAVHAFATELDRRAGAFLTWVESPDFPAVACSHRAEFRAGAERLAATARRLAVATERRRVDELIERATEALGQASQWLNRAVEGVLRDVAFHLQKFAVRAVFGEWMTKPSAEEEVTSDGPSAVPDRPTIWKRPISSGLRGALQGDLPCPTSSPCHPPPAAADTGREARDLGGVFCL
jgi:hypothetical protein